MLRKFFPATGNYLLEGVKLAILNAFFLGGGSGFAYGLLWLCEKIRNGGIPIPLPVGLILLVLVLPYFMIEFQYGKVYGSFIKKRRFIRGYIVGIIGQLPTFILLYFCIWSQNYLFTSPELYRIIIVLSGTVFFTSPLMVALGSVDQKKEV